jgi:hypothetical protein
MKALAMSSITLHLRRVVYQEASTLGSKHHNTSTNAKLVTLVFAYIFNHQQNLKNKNLLMKICLVLYVFNFFFLFFFFFEIFILGGELLGRHKIAIGGKFPNQQNKSFNIF